MASGYRFEHPSEYGKDGYHHTCSTCPRTHKLKPLALWEPSHRAGNEAAHVLLAGRDALLNLADVILSHTITTINRQSMSKAGPAHVQSRAGPCPKPARLMFRVLEHANPHR